MINKRYALACALLLSIAPLFSHAEPTESTSVDPFKVYQELLEQQGVPKQEPKNDQTDFEDERSIFLESAPTELKYIINVFKKLWNTDKKRELPLSMLFYGPPGTGKTSSAIAFAEELGIPYTVVDTPVLATKYQNSLSENLNTIIQKIEATKAPHIIILDEINMAFDRTIENKTERDPACTLWLAMDRVKKNHAIIFIGTANDISKLHEPLKSRFEEAYIQFSLPSDDHRRVSTSRILKKPETDALVSLVVSKTKNGSYRTVEYLIKKARWNAYRSGRTEITQTDIEEAFNQIQKHQSSRISRLVGYLSSNKMNAYYVLSGIANLGIQLWGVCKGNTIGATTSPQPNQNIKPTITITSQAG